MAEYVLFSDAMWVAIEGLTAGFAHHGLTAPVTSWPPIGTDTTVAPPMVTVSRTGGERRNVIADDAQITLEAWGTTPAEAADVVAQARAVLHALAGTVVDGIAVYRVDELAGPAWLPDPDSGTPRYSLSAVLTLHYLVTSS